MSKKQIIAPSIRSSAAEYLTFVAGSGNSDVNVRTINEHLQTIFADNELQEDSVIRKFRITATDGKNYDTQHYNLSAIIAVGYKVKWNHESYEKYER